MTPNLSYERERLEKIMQIPELRKGRAGESTCHRKQSTWYIPPGILPRINVFCFGHVHALLRRPWVFPRALLFGSRRGPACTLGASLGPGQAPWRVVWAFKVAKAAKQSRGFFPRNYSRVRQWKTHMSATAVKRSHTVNNRFKLSSVLQLRALLQCVCGPLLYHAWT